MFHVFCSHDGRSYPIGMLERKRLDSCGSMSALVSVLEKKETTCYSDSYCPRPG